MPLHKGVLKCSPFAEEGPTSIFLFEKIQSGSLFPISLWIFWSHRCIEKPWTTCKIQRMKITWKVKMKILQNLLRGLIGTKNELHLQVKMVCLTEDNQ